MDAQPFRLLLCRRLHLPHSVRLATIVQRALKQGFWVAGGFHLCVPPHRSAERQEHESPPTST